MAFRNIVMITLYARQQERHRCLEQSFGLCGGGMIWGNVMETCIISYKKRIASPGSIQDPWGWCTGMTRGMVWGGRWDGGSGWGTRVRPWWVHVDVWQN